MAMLSHMSTEITQVLFVNAGENIFNGGEEVMFIKIHFSTYH